MLTSLNTHEEEEEDPPSDVHRRHLINQHQSLISTPRHGLIIPQSGCRTRQLLINCAELLQQFDFSATRRLISLLSTTTSPHGDSTDRVAHQFAHALSLRLNHLSLSFSPPPPPPDADALRSSYLSLNKVTPFVRFSHLTANQAILEAVEHHRSIHILDFDTMHGVQWPPLLQAIADRSDHNDPPSIRITGAGNDLQVLCRTGERLKTFADGLGLTFQFHPLLLHPPNTLFTTSAGSLSTGTSATHDPSTSTFQLHPDETLAVNCVLFLHKLLKDDDGGAGGEVRSFLQAVKAMKPAIMTMAEREASHNSSRFLQRFSEAVEHYSSVFESLEATLPPNSRERHALEQVWFGREIRDIVAGEGRYREERHERFSRWEHLLRCSGFTNVPLSQFALSQAKLLLRLHYPSEGYQLQMIKGSLFLGWKNRPLFSVSSWQ